MEYGHRFTIGMKLSRCERSTSRAKALWPALTAASICLAFVVGGYILLVEFVFVPIRRDEDRRCVKYMVEEHIVAEANRRGEWPADLRGLPEYVASPRMAMEKDLAATYRPKLVIDRANALELSGRLYISGREAPLAVLVLASRSDITEKTRKRLRVRYRKKAPGAGRQASPPSQ